MRIQKLKSIFNPDYIAILITFLSILAGSLVSLNRFWQYDVFYYDFGIFDQAIWKASRFSVPIIDHFVVGGKWIFADHFNPGIFLLSPVYWITTRQESLLIIQAVTVGVSGFIIYLIAKHVTKEKFISLSILISYFLFVGLENAVITDFHEVTVATLPLALSFLFIIKNRIKLFLICLIIFLAFKESNFLFGLGIGVAIFLINKKQWRIALATLLISIFWAILSIKIIIPFFGNGYEYSESINLSAPHVISQFTDNPVKINTIFYSLLSFGFLPLLSPAFWFLIFQDFLVRFNSPSWPTRWTLALHYSALLSVIMAISGAFSINFINQILRKPILIKILAVILIINAVILYRFVLRGPFALSYNPAFYKHTADFGFLNKIIQKIPGNVTVMTQNNLAVRFTHQNVYLLRKNYSDYKPDYIAIDRRPGQNANDFFGERDFDEKKFIEKVKKDNCYKNVYSTDYQFIFQRICR